MLQLKRIILLFGQNLFPEIYQIEHVLLEKNLVSHWPSDDNDSTDDELQKDPPEAILDRNSPYKTYILTSHSEL